MLESICIKYTEHRFLFYTHLKSLSHSKCSFFFQFCFPVITGISIAYRKQLAAVSISVFRSCLNRFCDIQLRIITNTDSFSGDLRKKFYQFFMIDCSATITTTIEVTTTKILKITIVK